jgi:small ligand-binding sensory domain FIST
MIRAVVGLSTQWDALRAAREVSEQVNQQLGGARADWCVVFATYEFADHLTTLLPALNEMIGTPYVVGCSAAGVIVGSTEVEQGPALGVLAVSSDQLTGTPFMFDVDTDAGQSAGAQIGERLSVSRDSDDLLLVWPDACQIRPDRLLQDLQKSLGGVQVAGGAASARNAGEKTFQFKGVDASTSAVSGLRLGGLFNQVIGVSQGLRRLGRPLQVTESHDNLILELEGRPALNVLREMTPPGMLDDLDQAINTISIGLLPQGGEVNPQPGDCSPQNIVHADPLAGVLGISAPVREGQYVVLLLRDARAARTDLTRMLDDLSPQRTGLDYKFGLYFNCLARGQALYGDHAVDSGLIEQALPGMPLLGFFCNAEIGPLTAMNRIFTYSGVLILIAE